jgi:tripartite-type tricarboxylate transporter receptor subunit TctC
VGLFVPAATPRPIAEKLNAAVLKAVRDPDMKKRLDALAFEVTAAPLDETQRYVRSEVAKWAKVVKATGAKVD